MNLRLWVIRFFCWRLKEYRWGSYIADAPGIGTSYGWWLGWLHIGYWLKHWTWNKQG